jgi:hypothetical protein
VPIKVIDLQTKLPFVLIDDVLGEIPIIFGKPSAKAKRLFLQNDQQEELLLRTNNMEEAHL